MNKEDYFKYYIQGSDHYLIPKDVFNELFEEMESWKQDTLKYKEVIDKANNWVRSYMDEWSINDEVWQELNELLILLEEVE